MNKAKRAMSAVALAGAAALAIPASASAVLPLDGSASCDALKGACGSTVVTEPAPRPAAPGPEPRPAQPDPGPGSTAGAGAGGALPAADVLSSGETVPAKPHPCVENPDDTACFGYVGGLNPVAEEEPAEPTRPTRPAAPRVTPAQVVERARAQIKPAAPSIGSAPCTTSGCVGRVGVPVWLWTQPWQAQETSVTAGPFTVDMTAKPSRVVWSLGDGQSVTCTSPGTRYDTSMGWATSPDCGLPQGYQRMGRYTMTATMTWDISWSGAAQGSDTLTTTSSVPVAIGEVQAVVTN